jgi:signal transduction histidine kinase
VDLALAGALSLVSMQSAFDDGELKSPAVAVIGLILLTTLPLAYRQAQPIGVFAVTLAAAIAGFLAFNGYQLLGSVFALYTVARHCDLRSAAGALAVGLTAAIIPAVATGEGSVPFAVVMALAFGGVWALGRRGAAHAETLAAARARTEEAVALERARIARELHDVISHNVSVMVVQAAAGRDVFDANPKAGLQALTAIESVGREALQELRLLLDVVRPPDEHAAGPPYDPQPRLASIGKLADQLRTSGLEVELDVADVGALPAAVDLCAYRVVQEALTNVLKHATATRADVRVRRVGARIEIEVTDDGTTAERNGSGGHGLVGMRERVQLLDGDLRAGRRDGGGFSVQASIPVDVGVRT